MIDEAGTIVVDVREPPEWVDTVSFGRPSLAECHADRKLQTYSIEYA